MSDKFNDWCISVKDCGHEVQPNSATARQRKLGWDAAMATKREISDEGLLRALRAAQISEPMQKPWVVTRWKDGIGIEEPTQSLHRFAKAILNSIEDGSPNGN